MVNAPHYRMLGYNDFDLSIYFQYACVFAVKGSGFPVTSKKPEIVMVHRSLFLTTNHLIYTDD